ncbi:MAG: sugar ABC transporter ATP-binding protein [Cyanobacteria bacterium QS_8_64_29]|nr:MAG: sugar ABC transporter ATP-binding protein [Cyanobacteria bacterium QS_8_64_29]
MASVRVQGLSCRFEGAAAVEDITFEVPDGELWVLVGPSGCGKSTILRAIAGLTPIAAGTLAIGGEAVNGVPARARDVAMVFQNYALYPHMTVAQNLGFGLRMRGCDRATRNRQIDWVAQTLGIGHLLRRKPGQLSGGQQQRVALGRAIARRPRAFLLDEPLSNLDAQLRDETRAELKTLHRQLGITTLYVTHDQLEAMTLADRLVVLERGRIQQLGTPEAVYARPANRTVAAFLGSPPMNLLAATYSQGSLQIGDRGIPVPPALQRALASYAGQRLTVGIRPERLRLADEADPAGDGGLAGWIEVIEPLGREVRLRVRLPAEAGALDLFAPAGWQGYPGDHVNLSFDPGELFAFDGATGARCYPPDLG